ncbi:MAG: MoaD/ThiS family protein [Candidatus Bathyarchaeia archaeon]
MRVRVKAFGDLAPLIGEELTVDLEEGSKLSDLIQEISRIMNGFKERLEAISKRQGIIDPGLVILLNGCNINLLDGLNTRLKDGDVVVFLPPAAGGRV